MQYVTERGSAGYTRINATLNIGNRTCEDFRHTVQNKIDGDKLLVFLDPFRKADFDLVDFRIGDLKAKTFDDQTNELNEVVVIALFRKSVVQQDGGEEGGKKEPRLCRALVTVLHDIWNARHK